MKKVLAVISVVCVMCVAGSAMANQSRNARHRPMPPQAPGMEQRHDFRAPEGRFDGRPERPRPPFEAHCGKGHRFTPDMPPEIREKAAELAKLRVDLEEAMTAEPLNKAKALEVHAKILTVKNELEAWRFAQRLERIEAMRKQHELNKNVPPEKPEPEQAQ